MKHTKDEEFDDLVDPDWEPSPEDFVFEEKQEEEKAGNRKKWLKPAAIIIAVLLLFQLTATFFSTFSIDAVRFLQTSYRLSQQEDIQAYKQAVVVVQGDRSRGTGFAISADGLIVTNHHVIEDQRSLSVSFTSGELFEAELISSYPEDDLAFLKVEGANLPYLPLGSSEESLNEKIYVIGNPLSWTQIANEGLVLDMSPQVILSAPIYRGNSGSPVINHDGEVIAVVFAKRRTTKYGGNSVGVATPIEAVLEQLPEHYLTSN